MGAVMPSEPDASVDVSSTPKDPPSSRPPARSSSATLDWGEPRRKEVTWYDPLVTKAAVAKMTGLESMQAIRDGLIPNGPIGYTLEWWFSEAEYGTCEVQCRPDSSVYNQIGMVHGGFACTILDVAVSCAVRSTLPAGVPYTSIELKVNYLRPMTEQSGLITARGWLTKSGRRVGFANAEILDEAGKVLATAQGSVLILESE